MSRTMVGYCWKCCKDTKQHVIEAEDSFAWRVFETVTTLGFGLLMPHDYKRECSRCGHINTLTKG